MQSSIIHVQLENLHYQNDRHNYFLAVFTRKQNFLENELFEWHTFELLTIRGIDGYGTFWHCIIPKSFGEAFEQVHNGLNMHGGYLWFSNSRAPANDAHIINNIVIIIIA